MKNPVFPEFLRFASVGVVSTAINYGVFLISLYALGLDFITAGATGYIAGVAVGFGLNKRFTFKSDGSTKAELQKYFAVYTFSLFLGLSLLKLLVQSAGVHPAAANVLVIGVTTATNFIGSKFFAFRKTSLPQIFRGKLFLSVLLLKVVFAFLFASDFLLKGTIPFVEYFVSSGFQNPYQHFLELGMLKAFPYSTTMLITVSIPAFVLSFLPGVFGNEMLQLFLARLPLLAADIGIFYILLKLLKTRENEVLLYYWCSPIIFYITYFHGQLDAIPTFLLMLSLYLLLNEKKLGSALALGVALSAKANIFIAVPFIFLYLWRNQESVGKIVKYFAASLATYAVLVLPFIFTEGYQKLVLGAEEQWWVFLLNIHLGNTGIVLYIVPLALTLFFLRLSYFRKINQDALMMAFAGAFTILVTLVPPRPGWFFWAVPFLAYFFVKDENISKKNYWAINALFLLYFLVFNRESDLFASFQPISSAIASHPNVFSLLSAGNIDAGFVSSMVFTIFIALMFANFYFVYKFGIIANLRYRKSGLRVGIAGDSGSGKTYTNAIILDMAGERNVTVLEGDDLHKYERQSAKWEKLTHLNPKANLLHREIGFLEGMDESKKLSRRGYDHSTGKFTDEKTVLHKKFTLVSGLHSFYLAKMRSMLDIKIFLDPQASLKKEWKMQRDVAERGYSRQKVISAMRERKEDSQKFLSPQKKFADVLISYEMQEKERKGEGGKRLVVSLPNTFDADSLIAALEGSGVDADVEYGADLSTLRMVFSGKMGSERTAFAAYKLVPNLEEVLENRTPKWREGLDGAIQLILLMLFSENLKARKGGE